MSMYIASTKVLHDKPSIRIAGQVTKDYVDTFNKQKKAVMGMLFKKPPTNDEDVVVIKGEPIDAGKAIKGKPHQSTALPRAKKQNKTTKPIDVCEGFPPTKRQQDDTVDIDIINAVPPPAKRQGGTTSIEKPFNDGESDPKFYCRQKMCGQTEACCKDCCKVVYFGN
jgi:hypothetical protein